MSKKYDQFTNLYPLSKTLRFELKPIGETARNIDNFISKGEQRSVSYKIVKEVIDDYHRTYIEEQLTHTKTKKMSITPENIEEAYRSYQKLKPGDLKEKEAWNKVQETLRKQLVKGFANNNDLFKKRLITEDLPQRLKEKGLWKEKQEAVEMFNQFTTYFKGFHENRKNMYSDKDQGTAISYRLMNENLPRFFNNCTSYQKTKEKQPDFDFKVDPELLKKMKVDHLDEIFQPGYFVNLFTQNSLDNYQALLGGKTDEKGNKTQGLNEMINLYNQQQSDKKDRFSRFTSLYKQILSDRETHSFIPEAFKNNEEFLKSLENYIKVTTKKEGVLVRLERSMQLLSMADNEKVYVKTASVANISNRLFKNYGTIPSAISHHAEDVLFPNKTPKDPTGALLKKRKKFCRTKVFSIAQLDNMIDAYIAQLEMSDPLHRQQKELKNPKQPVYTHFMSAFKKAKKDSEFTASVKEVRSFLGKKEESNLNKKQQLERIQKMLDAFKEISHRLKPLHLVDKGKPIDMPDMDTNFYAEFSESYEDYSNTLTSFYNKTRNHLTKKPSSKDKIKLNFGIPSLLDGWDANKESDNASLIFEKNGLYYLGVMHSKHKRLFDYIEGINDVDKDQKIKEKDALKKQAKDKKNRGYRKVVYKLLPTASKMLPKVFFSKTRKDLFKPSEKILKIRNTASHTKNGTPQKNYTKEEFNQDDCHAMIKFFQNSIEKHPDWKAFNFQFSPPHTYSDISTFYKEIENQGYKIDFHSIKESYIDECVKEGKLFLFQIYNKDFSPYSKGKPNLHTLYWKGLFERQNLKDVVLKLNGQGEIFYRQHSIKKKDRTIHPANEAIENKNKYIDNKKVSIFDYDIIKDKRYTQDKYQFHVPITLNFKAEGVNDFNKEVNLRLKETKDTHVIGIDRGERHLLYYTIIDSKGNIVEQDTLNTIRSDKKHSVDYREKLHLKEQERKKARESWSTIENIKELKAGYLSHVVHKLAELIVKYNAIVCLEDLNFGFKRGRFHIEKQVYQKFEKTLIDKLNYLVFKDKRTGAPGSYLKAYQLTAPFQSFERLGKQSGILFYVGAAYTSKIDPVTGFMNFLKTRYESLEKSKKFFEKMNSIRFNSKKQYFEFTFDYKKINNPDNKIGRYQTQWTVCTFGDLRYCDKKNTRGDWISVPVNVTEELKELFEKAHIQYEDGQELIKSFTLSKGSSKDKNFYKTLLWLLTTTLSLRYSNKETDEDFILSPIANDQGEFFDSRLSDSSMPKNADANGAYNIALKGLWNLEQIERWDGEKRLNLSISKENWCSFISMRTCKDSPKNAA